MDEDVELELLNEIAAVSNGIFNLGMVASQLDQIWHDLGSKDSAVRRDAAMAVCKVVPQAERGWQPVYWAREVDPRVTKWLELQIRRQVRGKSPGVLCNLADLALQKPEYMPEFRGAVRELYDSLTMPDSLSHLEMLVGCLVGKHRRSCDGLTEHEEWFEELVASGHKARISPETLSIAEKLFGDEG